MRHQAWACTIWRTRSRLDGLADLQQHDRQVARDAVAPQPRLPAPVAQQRCGAGAQRGLRIDHAAGQARIQLRVGLGGVELAQHHLAVRPGQFEDAVGQASVHVLVRQRQAGLAARGRAVDDVDERRLIGLQRDHAPGRRHRVEHRAGGARERCGVPQRRRRMQPAAAADEARAVGLVRHRPGSPRRAPRREWNIQGGLLGRARAARGTGSAAGSLQHLGLHEQLAESRVRTSAAAGASTTSV
jgi:hypothetical protein